MSFDKHPKPLNAETLRRGGKTGDFPAFLGVSLRLCVSALRGFLLIARAQIFCMERKAFMELLNYPRTQERIMGMMQTGKPVRN